VFTDDAGKGGIAAGGPGNSENSMRRTGGDLVQLITPAGERISHPEFDPWLQDVSDEQLCALYEDMVVIRRIDAEATALQRQGELALWPPLLGQEASQIGSARALREDDFVFPSYRDNGVAYCRGVKPEDLVRAWRGNASAGWDPFTVNVATQQIIIGAQSLHATGYAMGIQNDGADCVAVAYFGDGATSEGDFHEALNFAAVFHLPVVFFVQNNQYAISVPLAHQSVAPSLAHKAVGYGMAGERVDGNDIVALLAVLGRAVKLAREGSGPLLVEAHTYRMQAHTNADDATRYRQDSEVAEWVAKDPLSRMQTYLTDRGLLDDDRAARIAEKAEAVATQLREGLSEEVPVEPQDLFKYVFSTPTPLLLEQSAMLADELARDAASTATASAAAASTSREAGK